MQDDYDQFPLLFDYLDCLHNIMLGNSQVWQIWFASPVNMRFISGLQIMQLDTGIIKETFGVNTQESNFHTYVQY